MFRETKTLWEYLKGTQKPIVMYGMGDGADKILQVLKTHGITPNAFMASDEFVRGQKFHGFSVKKLSDIEKMYDDFIILICFGTNREEVLERIYELAQRYEVYAPDVPVVGEGLFDERYLSQNIKKIVAVRKILADDLSRYVYDRLIDYRISGKIEYLKQCATPFEEILPLLDLKADGSETFVDLGAYDGDTVELFLKHTNKNFEAIYALEPDERNFTKLRRRNYALGAKKFMAFNAAAWKEDGELDFSEYGGRNSRAAAFGNNKAKNQRTITALTVDTVCRDAIPTLIKMDVEGCEANALLGAKQTIEECLPRLAVSLYHRTADMVELPLLIYQLSGGEYSMFLRHHRHIPAWDVNLYCI
ncbi:MAG: FkbM family methyltransferase [Oscillospiraceae bacterium]|nr:FkbM family methyltransferase [Oscillospiraceae bacterium]